MKLDDLDRILSSEEPITPSSVFVGNVMSSIQAETLPRFQIPFPWIPLLVATIPLVILSVLFLPADSMLQAMNLMTNTLMEWIVSAADSTLKSAILSAFASLLGTLVLIRLSLRLTGAWR